MRIGVNCFLLESHIGGLKQYFINLFDWLFENDRNNQYVFFYFRRNLAELAKLRSEHWKANGVLLDNQDQIAAHIDKIDLYFCPFSALWPRPVPIPSVMTLVDIQEVFYPQFFTAQDLYNREYHYPSSTRAADRVVTISEFSKSTLVEHHGISPEKVVVAHLCADPSYFRASEIQHPPDVPPPFAQFVFFPANRWYHKNHDVLLKALALLKERGREGNAVFTGFDVEGGYSVSKMAAEYGVTERVHSAGYVTVPQMAHLYRHAEMLVFPSLFEGFGMPPVEAMAAGCPVVVSNSTCLPEICSDAAEYFDAQDPIALADAICRLRDDPARRERLIQHGRSRAALFSAERMARAHLQAFAEAVGAYSPARNWWHRFVYQPYHRLRVNVRHAPRVGRQMLRNRRNCSVLFSDGWHGREQEGPNWLRWTPGSGRLKVYAPGAMQLLIQGEMASIERPNEVRVFANRELVASWIIDGEFGFREIPPVTAALRSGKNMIEFVSTRPGIRAGPDDPRALAIAVRNLSFSDPAGDIKCIDTLN